MDGGQHQQDYQKNYFQTIIKQYEDQNAQFRKKQCNLRHRLEAIECSMPALMCFSMMQGRNKQPESAEYDSDPVKEQPSSSCQIDNANFKNIRNDMNLRSCDCVQCPLNPDFKFQPKNPEIKTLPVNIRNDIYMKSCRCNPCPLNEDTKNPNPPPVQRAFATAPSDTYYQSDKPKFPYETPIVPIDVQYIAKIKGLAEDERKLKEEIEELEHKQRIYTETLKQTHVRQNKDIGCNGEGDFEIQALKRMNQELEANNKTLEEELEEVKREIKYIQDTVEEPMRKELENEKRKYMDLEVKIQKRGADISNRESAHQKKVIFLERQLQSASQNLSDLHVINKRLKEELCLLNCRYNELQTDLINQKLSEIHTISRMAAAQDRETHQPPLPKPVLSLSGVSSGDDLNNIARNLSELLHEANTCSSCKSAHPDLIDTVRYIKELVDIVNKDRKEPRKIDRESLSDVFCKCVDFEKLRAEMLPKDAQFKKSRPEDSDEQPTHEILPPKKFLSEESTSAVTKKESKPKSRVSIREKTSEKDVHVHAVTSGYIAAKDIQDELMSKLISVSTLDERTALLLKASGGVYSDETDQEETVESEAPTDTEDTGADVTVSASAAEEIVTESEPLTESTQLESEEPVSDIDERADLQEEPVTEEVKEEDSLLHTEIAGETLTAVEAPPTEAEAEKLHDEVLGEHTQMEEATSEVIDKNEEIMLEDTPKINNEAGVVESEPDVEVGTLEKPENILEIAEEDNKARKDDDVITEEDEPRTADDVITEEDEPRKDVITEEDEARKDDDEITEENEARKDDEITEEDEARKDNDEIKAIEEVREVATDDDRKEEAVASDIDEGADGETDMREVESSKEEDTILEHIEEADGEKETKDEASAKESERKDSEKIIPITENETVADIVRTICRCIPREKPQLCDCPIERTMSPKLITKPSKEGVGDLIEGEIKDDTFPDESESSSPEIDTTEETIGDDVPSATGDGVPSAENVGDAPPPDESESGAPPDESGGSVSPDESEGGAPPDESEGGVLPDESGFGAPPDEAGVTVPPDESEGDAPPDDGGGGALPEESEGGVPPDENVGGFLPDESGCETGKVSPKTSQSDKVMKTQQMSPKASITDTDTSKERITPDQNLEPTVLPKEHVDRAFSDVPIRSSERSKSASKEPSTKSLPLEGTKKVSVSSITPIEASKQLSGEHLPKEQISPTKVPLLEHTPEVHSGSRSTSKEPSVKSIHEDITKPVPSEKLKEDTSEQPIAKEAISSTKDSLLERPETLSKSKSTSKDPSVKSIPKDIAKEAISSTKDSLLERPETLSKSKSTSKDPSVKSIPKDIAKEAISSTKDSLLERPETLSKSKSTSKDPSVKSIPKDIAKEAISSTKDSLLERPETLSKSKSTSKDPSVKSIPKDIAKEAISSTKDSLLERPETLSKSKSTSKDPSVKSIPKDIARPVSIEKATEEMVDTQADKSREKIISREASVKIVEQVVSQTSSTKDVLPTVISAKIEAEAEGNVPTETDVELITKSSDGVYVTTTVTSSGHVEVTTEGPTGVVETTLKVTESGNLEVVTGLTEYDKPDKDSDQGAKSDHSEDDIPEVEVIHGPVRDMKESQDALDTQESSKSIDQGPTTCWEEESPDKHSAEKVEEEAKQPSDGVLDVITEEEESVEPKEKEFVEAECQYEESVATSPRREQEQPPPGMRYCTCPPPLVICKCDDEVDEDQEQVDENAEQVKDSIQEEADVSAEQVEGSIQEEVDENAEQVEDSIQEEVDENAEQVEDTIQEEVDENAEEVEDSIQEEVDQNAEQVEDSIQEEVIQEPTDVKLVDETMADEVSVTIKTESTDDIQSIEIITDVLPRDKCYHKTSDEFAYEEVVSGSTVSDVSMFDDMMTEHNRHTKIGTSDTSHIKSIDIQETPQYDSVLIPVHKSKESAGQDKAHVKSLSIEETPQYESEEAIVHKPIESATLDKTKSILKHTDTDDHEKNVIAKREFTTATTSTTDLKYTTCTCEKQEGKKNIPNEEENISKSSEEKHAVQKQADEQIPSKQLEKSREPSPTYANTTVNNLKIIICSRDLCKTHATDDESYTDISKCQCSEEKQGQLPKICTKKTCGTSTKSRKNKNDNSNEKGTKNKLLLENATCTTCDKASCQVIKSRTQYASSESVLDDETVICPATCSTVGVQHTIKKLSCEDVRKREYSCELNEKQTMSTPTPHGVCASSCTHLDDKKVCAPNCKETETQETSRPKRSLKSHATNTPKSSEICNLNVCESKASEQRTVSTYYSCNLVEKEISSPSEREKRLSNIKPQIAGPICDPSACKKEFSLLLKQKSPSAPQFTDHKPGGTETRKTSVAKTVAYADPKPGVAETRKTSITRQPVSDKCECKKSDIVKQTQFTRICNSKLCKMDAYTDYKPGVTETRKTSITEQSASDKCTCKKSAEKSDIVTQIIKQPLSIVDEKSDSIMQTACTSLTCSAMNTVSGATPCSSATCSGLEVRGSVKSKTSSKKTSDTGPYTPTVCSARRSVSIQSDDKKIDEKRSSSAKSDQKSSSASTDVSCSCSGTQFVTPESSKPSVVISKKSPSKSSADKQPSTASSKKSDTRSPSKTISSEVSKKSDVSSPIKSITSEVSKKSGVSFPGPNVSSEGSKRSDIGSPIKSINSEVSKKSDISSPSKKNSSEGSKKSDIGSPIKTMSSEVSKKSDISSPSKTIHSEVSKKSDVSSSIKTIHSEVSKKSDVSSSIKTMSSEVSKKSDISSPSKTIHSEVSKKSDVSSSIKTIHSEVSKKSDVSSSIKTMSSEVSKKSDISSPSKKNSSEGSKKSDIGSPIKTMSSEVSKKSDVSSPSKTIHSEVSKKSDISSPSKTINSEASKKSDVDSPSKTMSPEVSKRSHLSTSSSKRSDINSPSVSSKGETFEKTERSLEENNYHSPKSSQEISSHSYENEYEPPVEPVTVETLEKEIRTWNHNNEAPGHEIGSKSKEETNYAGGSLHSDSKIITSNTQQSLPQNDVQTTSKSDVKPSEGSDMRTASKISGPITEPFISEIPKAGVLSTGDIPKFPKSASRYTLTEKLPSVSDYKDKMRKSNQSFDQNKVTATKDTPLSKRPSEDEKDSSPRIRSSSYEKEMIKVTATQDTSPSKRSSVDGKGSPAKIGSPSYEKEIIKEPSVHKKEVQDSESTPSRKSSGSTQAEEKSSKRPSKESDTMERKPSRASKGSTDKSSERSVKSSEQKSSEKMPTQKADSKGSIQSSEGSICHPCGKIQGKASGDIISQEIKKPPDKSSKSSMHSTDSEKRSKSKIPVPISQTPSQVKEKHQGDCACMECLTDGKQKEGHPPDCDCVDCLCQPSKFEKKLSIIEEGDKEGEHSLSCTCIDCLCQPKDGKAQIETRAVVIKDKKPAHSPSCICVDCLCAPSEEKVKPKTVLTIEKQPEKQAEKQTEKLRGAQIHIVPEKQIEKQQQLVYSCPSMPPTKRHHPDCKCPSCVCDPCTRLPNCSCKVCRCNPCKDEIVQFKKHPPDCTCADCLCAPCGDQKVEEAKQHPPQCSCADCICDPCQDKEVQERKERLKHPPDCNCSDCVCEPCSDPKIQKEKDAKKQHPVDCNCPKCICDPCNDKNIKEKPKKHIEDGDCTCEECICDPCDDPKVVRAKIVCGECKCFICVCNPCDDPKIVKSRKPHPPSCNCKECLCDPCSDPSKSRAHGPDCTCRKCICHPCKADGEDHGPNCKCPTCVCEECPDPQKKKPVHGPDCKCKKCVCQPCKSDAKEHGPNCNCPTCICDPCLDPEKKKSLHGLDCTCPRCECEKQAAAPIEKHSPNCRCSICKRKPNLVEPKRSLHGADCTCEPCKKIKEPPVVHSANCKCSVCKQKTKPVEGKEAQHDPNCSCEKCRCDPCEKVEHTPEAHSANCKCSVCKQKLPKETPKPKLVASPQTHSSNCKCKNCNMNRDMSEEAVKDKPTAHQTDLPDIPEECPECDCSPICVCDDCPAKRNNTAPVAKKMKDEALKKNIKDIEKENGRREKDIHEIEQLMDQIRCACNDAERQAALTVPPEATLIERTASFKNTLSGLQIAMNALQDKCKVKDKMIDAMTQELRIRANSNIFNDMLRNMAGLPPVHVDFDMHEICDSLPRPSTDPRYGRPSYRFAEEPVTNAICTCETGSLALTITSVKQISPNSILVKWTQPASNQVIGYEVMVENVMKTRIHSAQRTSAIVFAIEMKSKLNISVYALTLLGRCEPPATCIYG